MKQIQSKKKTWELYIQAAWTAIHQRLWAVRDHPASNRKYLGQEQIKYNGAKLCNTPANI